MADTKFLCCYNTTRLLLVVVPFVHMAKFQPLLMRLILEHTKQEPLDQGYVVGMGLN